MKTCLIQSNVLFIDYTVGQNSSEAYLLASLSAKKSGENFVQILHQGKAVVEFNSNSDSPNYGNTLNGITDLQSIFDEITTAMKQL